MSEAKASGPRRVPRGWWLIGLAMVAIFGTVVSPFVMSYFGYGVPFRGTVPLTWSDAFIIFGALSTSMCLGWAFVQRLDRLTERRGRRPRWIAFVASITLCALNPVVFRFVPLEPFYAQSLASACGIMVAIMVMSAATGNREKQE